MNKKVIQFNQKEKRNVTVFDFARVGREQSKADEQYSVILLEGSVPDAEERFGPSLEGFPVANARFHHVGNLLLLHRDSDEEEKTECILMCKNLNENERDVLLRQVSNLAGHTYADGSEWEAGWYYHENFYSRKVDWSIKKMRRESEIESLMAPIKELTEVLAKRENEDEK